MYKKMKLNVIFDFQFEFDCFIEKKIFQLLIHCLIVKNPSMTYYYIKDNDY